MLLLLVLLLLLLLVVVVVISLPALEYQAERARKLFVHRRENDKRGNDKRGNDKLEAERNRRLFVCYFDVETTNQESLQDIADV